ncbi:MAG: respiratory nitrate reductase subunit gamma [Desulfovibrionaceae bacterium]
MKSLIFFFVVYPYICLALLLFGLLLRYVYTQNTWNARSSEIFEKQTLRIGSMLFHLGILFSFGGHILGLVLPPAALQALGLSMPLHMELAGMAGKILAPLVILGLGILLFRRLCNAHVAATTTRTDIVIILLILLNACTYQSYVAHFPVFSTIGPWLRSVLTFYPAPVYLMSVPLFMQIHIVSGLTIFALLPFSRLVHIFSVPLTYITFPAVLYRKRYGNT